MYEFFATTKCPQCGKTEQHQLSGVEFYTEENTTCSHCGHIYPNITNCIDIYAHIEINNPHVNSNRLANVLSDKLQKGIGINLVIVSTDKFQKELERGLAGFSTAELEKELRKCEIL